MPPPLRTDYAQASLERLDESRILNDAGVYAGAIYLAGLAAESILKAFIESKGDEIEGHNIGLLATHANLSRRLKSDVRRRVEAAITEAAPLWRNLFRYSGSSDLDRMGREFRLRFEVGGRLESYASLGGDGTRLWAERLYSLASLIVQERHLLWQSNRR